nr:nickel pincer cofactor biosynthesis protein LarC [Microlunatus panaciterrae]
MDVTAGVAGDMLLGALVDAGADLDRVQAAVDAVVPRSVRLTRTEVNRGGQRSGKVEVDVLVDDPPHRTWASIRALLADADLAPITRQRALATFSLLADAEGFVHGIPPADVHFHEVGALDSIADVVGCCEALRLLGVGTVTASPLAVGAGRVRIAHGDIPVPVPAVAQLARDWPLVANPRRTGDDPRPVGELATPTGVALVRALAERCEDGPSFTLRTVGVGAGNKDFDGWPNVVRVLVGAPAGAPAAAQRGSAPALASAVDGDLEQAVQLEANVDDLDPRLWPGVLEALLSAGAMDAWLVPILMKKGRPAHTLCALAAADRADRIADVIFAQTSTIGIRQHAVARRVLARRSARVQVAGQDVTVKISHRSGRIVQATPEFDEVAALASTQGLPVADLHAEANAAVVRARLTAGAPLPTPEVSAGHGHDHPHDHGHGHGHSHDHGHAH